MNDCRELSAKEADDARALFLRAFGHEARQDWWHWKYRGKGLLDSIHWGAFDASGKLFGHVGALALRADRRYLLDSPSVLVQVCDVMVSPQHRGWDRLGFVYRRMMESFAQEIARRWPGSLAFGFPGERPHRLGERLGFYSGIDRYAICKDMSFDIHRSHRLSPQFSGRLCTWDEALPHIDRWAEKALLGSFRLRSAHPDQGPTVLRDSRYLTWRYRDHPLHQYGIWLLHRHDLWRIPVVGWLVSRESAQGPPVLVDGWVKGFGMLTQALASFKVVRHNRSNEPEANGAQRATEAQGISLGAGSDLPLASLRWQLWLPQEGIDPTVSVVATRFNHPSQWQGSVCQSTARSNYDKVGAVGIEASRTNGRMFFTAGDTDVW